MRSDDIQSLCLTVPWLLRIVTFVFSSGSCVIAREPLSITATLERLDGCVSSSSRSTSVWSSRSSMKRRLNMRRASSLTVVHVTHKNRYHFPRHMPASTAIGPRALEPATSDRVELAASPARLAPACPGCTETRKQALTIGLR
jgi:hypothetical protein